MNFNLCIVKPEGYIHSAAFTELAELVALGLGDLGHPVSIMVNKIRPDARNIIIGCHLLDPSLIGQTPQDSIVLNTEQVYKDETAWNENIFKWVTTFETWDYSERNLSKLRSIGAIRPQLLRLGFHPKLARIDKPAIQDIDVLFYGSINERRRRVLVALQAAGIHIHAVFGVYGPDRDRLIARSKVVLNLHAYNSKIFEVVRVFYLMTNAKAVVGEVDPDTSIESAYLEGISASRYEDIVDKCKALIADDKARHVIEKRALTAIQQLPQAMLMCPLVSAQNDP